MDITVTLKILGLPVTDRIRKGFFKDVRRRFTEVGINIFHESSTVFSEKNQTVSMLMRYARYAERDPTKAREFNIIMSYPNEHVVVNIPESKYSFVSPTCDNFVLESQMRGIIRSVVKDMLL
jgi:hypothetical protein